jgi:hypothetical protein
MRYLALLAIFVAAAAVPAVAQSAGRIAVGGAIGTRIAPSSTMDGDPAGVSLLWRFGQSKEGGSWDWGLNWFSSHVDHSFDAMPTFELGKLSIRAILGGYGYTHVTGPTAIKASLLGGYAFSSFKTLPAGVDAYQARSGAEPFSTDASNTFVLRPQVSIWRNVSPKVGVNVSVAYLIARPDLTVRSILGEERQRLRADMLMIKVGLAYSVF